MSVNFRGFPACACLAKWLPVYEAELLRRGVIKFNIDIYQLIGGAAASAGTHSKGGAFDIAQTQNEAIKVARQMGADATWHRTPAQGFVSHTHGVLRGCPHNTPARYQITAVDKGFNGLGHLGEGGPDDGPRPLSGRTWQEGIAWAKGLQKPDRVRLKLQLSPMQFSDSRAQHKADAAKVFTLGSDIVFGTEAGPGSNNLPRVLRREAKKAGYRFYLPKGTSCWVAVRKDIIAGNVKVGFEQVIWASTASGDPHRYGQRGIAWLAFDHAQIGRITVGASHYLTLGRFRGQSDQDSKKRMRVADPVDHWSQNKRLGAAISGWAAEHNAKKDIIFFAADTNMLDSQSDVFFGHPLTTCWDELKKWPNTGHGPIDVIASADRDGRVSCHGAHVLKDNKFQLAADHFTTIATYDVVIK